MNKDDFIIMPRGVNFSETRARIMLYRVLMTNNAPLTRMLLTPSVDLFKQIRKDVNEDKKYSTQLKLEFDTLMLKILKDLTYINRMCAKEELLFQLLVDDKKYLKGEKL